MHAILCNVKLSVTAITETRQYLTFKLLEETFAVDVAKVREILELVPITRIPRTPNYMQGVINLRGSVVPVMDMRLKFGIKESSKTVNTCIVVVEVMHDAELLVIGALVDSVEEVFELEPDQIEPAPKIGTKINTDYLMGMGRNDGQFIMILDIDRTFTTDELSQAVDVIDEAA